MKLADFPNLKTLSARQKLRLAEELWFDAVDEQSLPVPAWHKDILRERMKGYTSRTLKTISIRELKRRLQRR